MDTTQPVDPAMANAMVTDLANTSKRAMQLGGAATVAFAERAGMQLRAAFRDLGTAFPSADVDDQRPTLLVLGTTSIVTRNLLEVIDQNMPDDATAPEMREYLRIKCGELVASLVFAIGGDIGFFKTEAERDAWVADHDERIGYPGITSNIPFDPKHETDPEGNTP